MVLYGIRGTTADIDLGCTKRLADQLELAGFKTERLPDGTRRISYAPDIEIFEDWLYGQVVEVKKLPVISLNGLIEMKKALGREKDFHDICLIEGFLSSHHGQESDSCHETQQEVKGS